MYVSARVVTVEPYPLDFELQTLNEVAPLSFPRGGGSQVGKGRRYTRLGGVFEALFGYSCHCRATPS
jgi:hypothetical protein